MTPCITAPFVAAPVWDVVPMTVEGFAHYYTLEIRDTVQAPLDLARVRLHGLSRDDLIALRATLDAALNPLIAPILARGP